KSKDDKAGRGIRHSAQNSEAGRQGDSCVARVLSQETGVRGYGAGKQRAYIGQTRRQYVYNSLRRVPRFYRGKRRLNGFARKALFLKGRSEIASGGIRTKRGYKSYNNGSAYIRFRKRRHHGKSCRQRKNAKYHRSGRARKRMGDAAFGKAGAKRR